MTEKMNLRLMPARPGTCSVCATFHHPCHAHDLQSYFYGVRFKMKYGRDPTWADACAHLTEEQRRAWRSAMSDVGLEWSEPSYGDPIADPYAVSDPWGDGMA